MNLHRTTFHIALLVYAVAMIVITSPPSRAATCPQSAIALRAGNALIAAAQAGSASQFASALRTYADMRKIALFGLGRHRRAVPAAKMRKFTNAATIMVSQTFNSYRRKFRANSIDFVDCRSGKVYTRMFFLGGKGYQPVVWRFSGNRITDVNVQSMWLGQLLRSYINGKMKKHDGDIDAVIREMSL